jgi:hypothetical protein
MPFASLRNAIPRKTNKERSQPADRKKHVSARSTQPPILGVDAHRRATSTLRKRMSCGCHFAGKAPV